MELTKKRSVSPGVWVGLFICLQIVSPLSRYLFKTFGLQQPVLDLSALSFTHLLMLIALGAMLYRIGVDYKASLRAYIESITRDLGVAAVITALILGIAALMAHYGILGHTYAGNGALLRKLTDSLGADITGKILIFASFSLLGPVFEEVFYRRLLYISLRQRYSVPRAIAVGALVFALVHPEALFFQFIVGAIYCYTYERYKRLDILIFSHIMCNASIISLALFR